MRGSRTTPRETAPAKPAKRRRQGARVGSTKAPKPETLSVLTSLSNRAARAAERREAIIEAALDEFIARGFTATRLDDVRIRDVRPLISPALLQYELPADAAVQAFVERSRTAVARVVHGADARLLVVVGPCSIHDSAQAMEYAGEHQLELVAPRQRLL